MSLLTVGGRGSVMQLLFLLLLLWLATGLMVLTGLGSGKEISGEVVVTVALGRYKG